MYIFSNIMLRVCTCQSVFISLGYYIDIEATEWPPVTMPHISKKKKKIANTLFGFETLYHQPQCNKRMYLIAI